MFKTRHLPHLHHIWNGSSYRQKWKPRVRLHPDESVRMVILQRNVQCFRYMYQSTVVHNATLWCSSENNWTKIVVLRFVLCTLLSTYFTNLSPSLTVGILNFAWTISQKPSALHSNEISENLTKCSKFSLGSRSHILKLVIFTRCERNCDIFCISKFLD